MTILDVKDNVFKDLIKGQGLTFTIWNGWDFIIYLDSNVYIVNKIVNTYAWIKDTAISRIIKVVCPIKINTKDELKNVICDLMRDIIKWPAVILAINRTAKVKGRIILLINSIKTMNIIRLNGVPLGIKWDNMFFVFLIQP